MLDVRLLDFHGYKEGSQRRAFFVSNQFLLQRYGDFGLIPRN
jgi:hypothetical protein